MSFKSAAAKVAAEAALGSRYVESPDLSSLFPPHGYFMVDFSPNDSLSLQSLNVCQLRTLHGLRVLLPVPARHEDDRRNSGWCKTLILSLSTLDCINKNQSGFQVMEVVSPHWSQFPPVNPLIPHFFGILFFFLWVMSFIGNGCVIYIFLKVKSLRTPVIRFFYQIQKYYQFLNFHSF